MSSVIKPNHFQIYAMLWKWRGMLYEVKNNQPCEQRHFFKIFFFFLWEEDFFFFFFWQHHFGRCLFIKAIVSKITELQVPSLNLSQFFLSLHLRIVPACNSERMARNLF